ncbi:MotA/TolQ/ExbB proton channel family protein [bacterium]|nr:MotA/TolQ/ExbB proton channel family protein [bacterium]
MLPLLFLAPLLKGGPILWILILLSVYAGALVAERRRAMALVPATGDDLVNKIADGLAMGDTGNVEILLNSRSDPFAKVLHEILLHRDLPRREIREGIRQVGTAQLAALKTHLPQLATIVTTAPLLGLLGTVYGLMKLFADLETGGAGDYSQLSGGISVALITTFAGLSIGIIFLLFLQGFRTRIDKIALELERGADEVLRLPHFADRPQSGGGSV